MQSKEQSYQTIKEIILNGNAAQKRYLFSFNKKSTVDEILLKFKLFSGSLYHRYFPNNPASFHDEMVRNMVKSYLGEDFINLAFRASAKTTLAKLFIVFVLLNDEDLQRRYIKILSRDMKNPKQIVTDVYNMCLEASSIYGDVFEKEGDKKREETMASFTMKSGVKLTAGTVGQAQRGHAQDAYRPDWIWFDDIEDRESVSSQAITESIIMRCDEALTGLAKGGSYLVTGNYISEDGVIQWFLNKKSATRQITPIQDELGVPTWSIFTEKDIKKLKDESEDFFGEYMCDPTRSDGKFFDLDRIDEDLKKCIDHKLVIGDTKYWGSYIQHHRYGIGADTSEGVGLDSSALTLWDFRTGELLATSHSNTIRPELFAYEMARVGGEFGKCVIAPEINNMSGGIVITTLKNIYDNIYRMVDKTNVLEREAPKYGWHTNSRTKPQMLMDFRRDYNDGLMKIYDRQLLLEMKSYRTNDLSESSKITRHFDLLMAAAIGWQMKDVLPERNVATVSYSDY